MEHFYDKIEGWFDFQNIYSEVVNKFPDGSHFVEIGAWMGKSTSYMAVEIANSGKKIKFDVIDTWEGSKGSKDEGLHVETINSLGTSLYQKFLENIEPVKEFINPIQAWSYDVVDNYKDNSLDFVFIDGAHDYESVKRDIIDWYPKVKQNGIIAGHDYNIYDWPGVVQAVDEFFGEKKSVVKKDTWSWIVEKKDTDKEMTICLYTTCIDEEDMMRFFMDYYTNYVGVNKFVIYDGGSKDDTIKIIKEYPNVELIQDNDEYTDHLKFMRIWNEDWKKDRNYYDWMIVCTPDEFLYHPNLREKLKEYKNNDVTIPKIEGFNMISLEHPQYKKGYYLPFIIKRGIKDDIFMNKNIIFNPQKVNINYRIGCHACDPIGHIVYSDNEELKLLHFQKMSYQSLIKDSIRKHERLSKWMLENNAGYHYKLNSQLTEQEYIDTYETTKYVLNSYNIDNKIVVDDLELLKIIQLKTLEDFMNVENEIQLIGDEKIIKINNYKFNNGRCELLLPYLINKGYKPIEENNDLVLITKKEKDIYVFSHNYLINNWEEILEEQLYKVKKSGLYKNCTAMFLYAFGDDTNWDIFEKIIKSYDDDNKIKIKRHNDNFYEYYTLQDLWNFSQNIVESYILYFHLKGVWSTHNLQINNEDEYDSNQSKRNPDAINKWRNCLEYFNIERWYDCIDKLNEGYDTVGALYNYNPEVPIYTGNFWWANSIHVKKLEKPIFDREKEPYEVKLWIRIKCEKWINSISNNFYNFYSPDDLGVYHIPIPFEKYRDDINPLVSIITSSYKKYEELNNAIKSVINQTYSNWEMLICSDGYDEIIEKIVKDYNNHNILYYSTDTTNDYGSTQKNYLTSIANGKYLIYLDDDNIIYPNYLETIIKYFDSSTGMIICRIDYDGLEYCLPIEDKLILGKVDTLCLSVDKYYTKHAIWKNYAGQDYEFMKICENNILNHSKNVKFIPDILGRHIDKIKSISNNMKYSFITPTYKRYESLKKCIDSVRMQSYNNWEMLICSDGADAKVENLILSYNDSRLKYFFTEQTNFFGTHQRNYLIEKTTGDYLIFLDDDNYLYDDHLKTINDKIENSDLLIYHINFENYECNVLPVENKIEHRRIDSLNFVVKSVYSKRYKWKKIYEHDYLYFKNIEADIVEEGGVIKYIPDILAIHCDKSKIINEPQENSSPHTVYIITSHPNYKMAENITIKTLEKIKSFGEKIILSSHCPVSLEIQKLTDYFVYDKNNPLIKHDFFTQSWFTTDEYYALLNITKNGNNLNHALGVFLNYYNSIILAKSQGFNIAVCTNFDMVFGEDDKKVIDNKIQEMIKSGKKAFFMKSPETEGIHYKTIFFITEIDYFLDNFKYISNENMYSDEMRKVNSNTNCLENFFYHTLKNKTNDLLLQEINENKLFPNSQINLFSLIEYTTILPVEYEPDNFVIWFSSANSLDSRFLNVDVRKNGSVIINDIEQINQKHVYFKKIKFTKGDVFSIEFRITNNALETLSFKSIIVDDIVFNDIKSYGNFIDKKNTPSI